MDLGLKGKVALVTAGSQGIGLATAHALAREGAQLALCARDAAGLTAAAAALEAAHGQPVLVLPCDLADEAQIGAMVAAVLARYGTVHVLVNNAGGPPPGPSARVSEADWQSSDHTMRQLPTLPPKPCSRITSGRVVTGVSSSESARASTH
jgi:NAD(P)-dependent dehydrogenase (short-subunit alcohol dehydrogenase family)